VKRLLLLLCGLGGLAPTARAEAPFALKDGDRVVLLGDAFIERDQATATSRRS
jgi:hypothetical protein